MNNLIPLGKIVKPHGAEGFLKLNTSHDIELTGKFLFIELEGAPVPFLVIDHKINGLSLILLEDIKNKEEAVQLSGKKIFIQEKDLEEYDLQSDDWIPFLEGFQLIDQHKNLLGKIDEILEYPSQIIAKIGEQMIPIHEDLILQIDPKKKTIQMDLPEGLFS
ncbi:MAG: rRNA processing protein rimm [Bacteroidota bacterium]|jgi:16S rRNA processing protein RimM